MVYSSEKNVSTLHVYERLKILNCTKKKARAKSRKRNKTEQNRCIIQNKRICSI